MTPKNLFLQIFIANPIITAAPQAGPEVCNAWCDLDCKDG